jgi:hypothetical protein
MNNSKPDKKKQGRKKLAPGHAKTEVRCYIAEKHVKNVGGLEKAKQIAHDAILKVSEETTAI